MGATESLYLKCALERGEEGRLDEGQTGSREATWKVSAQIQDKAMGVCTRVGTIKMEKTRECGASL